MITVLSKWKWLGKIGVKVSCKYSDKALGIGRVEFLQKIFDVNTMIKPFLLENNLIILWLLYMVITAPHDEVHTISYMKSRSKGLIVKITSLRSSYSIEQEDFMFGHFIFVFTACQLGAVNTSSTADTQITRTMDQLQSWYHLAPPLPLSLIKVRLNVLCLVF